MRNFDSPRRSRCSAGCLRALPAMLLVAVAAPRLVAQESDPQPKPDDYDQWRLALQAEATEAFLLETLPDFEVELLRSARPGEGSWINLEFDPEGRLTIAREDQGLVRLVIPDIPIDPRHEVPHPPLPPDERLADEEGEEPSDDGGKDDPAYESPQNEVPGEAASGEDEVDGSADSSDESAEEGDSGEEEMEAPFDPFFLRPVEETLKECRGLLYAYDALYVNANNSKGLYRLRDNDNDGKFEEVTLLKKTPGGVGHGRNNLVLGPDGLIYTIHGNDVQLPEDYEPAGSPYRHFAVDVLLSCEWNKYLFNAGATVPAGHLVRTDAEGKMWEVVAGGFRNPYGIAFNEDGEAFTYDADMEWDAGAPWYRPTRVHHIVSGADYGWRQGTGKWPTWYPDSLPANLDIGLGSPTAVKFGTDSNFPNKYKQALFILDWAYGRILAVHLSPQGATYTGEMEEFLKGKPLNITDMAFGPDGHMYFITGGRKTQSGLYRVKYTGVVEEAETATEVNGQDVAQENNAGEEESPSSTAEPVASASEDSEAPPDPFAIARAERRQLEEFHGVVKERAVEAAWDYLDSEDLWLRHAARVAIESQPVERWTERCFAESRPTAALTALMALARVGEKQLQGELLKRLAAFPLDELDAQQRLIALRTYQLCFIRMGSPDRETSRRVAALLAPHYPSDDTRADRLLCELLVYLNSPEVIEKTVRLLEGDRSEKEKLHYLFTLRHVAKGWTMEQRKTYFHWLRKARGFPGAHYIPRFTHYIEQDALAHLTPQQREEITPILNMKVDEPEIDLGAGREVVKDWKMIDFLFTLDKVDQGRDYENGRKMFAVAQCGKCHRVGAEGRAVGPDLTDVSKRFNRQDLLVSILSPSKVIADKYRATQFEMESGKLITGMIVGENEGSVTVSADPLAPEKLTTLQKSEIAAQSPSSVSTMPEDLLNTLKLEEILDLLAYVESGGDAMKENFK